MKTLGFVFTIATLFSVIVSKVFAQDPQQPSNYVVIGAFAKLNNAVRFTDMANQESFRAQYAINTRQKLYYVFILNTAERKNAFSFLIKIRVETKFKDAWVYEGKLGEDTGPAPAEITPATPVEEKPVVVEVIEPVAGQMPKRDSAITLPVVTIDSSEFKKSVNEIVEKKPDVKPFYFKLVNSESGSEVLGEVHVVESKATQYQGFKGNELVYLMPPKNTTGVYQASVQAPGYKRAKMAFNYKDPSASASGIGEKQESIFTFELVPAKKGDYIDFNNVRFFRNSSILEPGSQNELDGLAALMKENPKYKIKIHGHSNGDESRDIITIGTSTNVFALDPSQNTKEEASAKRLTELRAEAVENYLTSQGIEQGRIATKGEGGKMMIYPRASTLANYNDRVEIEVLKGR